MRTLRARILAAVGVGSLAIQGSIACGSEETSTGSGGAGGAAGMQAAGSAGTSSAGSGGTLTSGIDAATDPVDGSAGAGCLPECVTIRRPFLVGSSMRAASPTDRDDWSLSVDAVGDLDERTRTFLAASWLKDGLEEHASIAAFARFTMLLLSVGAPPELELGSQRASLDEIHHARACFALARRYGCRDAGPSALEVADSLTAHSLAELTTLTIEEGCVGETLGALLAAEQLERATDPEVVRILRRIARDEARHAELAWRFLAWARSAGGTSLDQPIAEAFRRALHDVENMEVRDYGVDLAQWHAHGRLTCVEAREVSRRGIAGVILPARHALFTAAPLAQSNFCDSSTTVHA